RIAPISGPEDPACRTAGVEGSRVARIDGEARHSPRNARGSHELPGGPGGSGGRCQLRRHVTPRAVEGGVERCSVARADDGSHLTAPKVPILHGISWPFRPPRGGGRTVRRGKPARVERAYYVRTRPPST